jgi:hypothetical protein
MKYSWIYLLSVLFLLSCSKQSKMSREFNCSNHKIENHKTTTDFKNKFKLTNSSNWKTELYFNEYQSEIFVADTTKQLTESFILITSFNRGVLNLDTDFYKRIDSISKNEKLQVINSGKQSFQSNPAYWYVAKGIKHGLTYHQFNITVKQSENTYFNAYSEIYGDNKINERICETISILEKVEFL